MCCPRLVKSKPFFSSFQFLKHQIGVIRLTFDPYGTRRIARFDLTMGPQIQGFTFNIGDSITNNGYGGDGGTTSNSAEIHSNENRFYVSISQ